MKKPSRPGQNGWKTILWIFKTLKYLQNSASNEQVHLPREATVDVKLNKH
jgi:hypothetical protein